jgi:PAS domain S-box-containing protein
VKTEVHKLLARQLRAAARSDGKGVDVDALLAIIDRTYDEFDRERRLHDRSTTLMEEELVAANEQAQREHSVVLATILESVSDGMLVTQNNGVIDTANDAAELQFGAARGGLSGENITKLMGEETRTAALARSASGRTHEGAAQTLDGRGFPVEIAVSILGERQLWIIRDISERIGAQREITENRQRFQDFAEVASDCFFEVDASLSRVSAQSSVDSALATRLVRLLTPGSGGRPPEGVPAEAWEALRRSFTARESFRGVRLTMVQENGKILHISLGGKPVFDLDGVFRGYRGTGRDLTREVAAQEAARRAERRMIEAMEGAPAAIALLDGEFHFVAGNSALRVLAPGQAQHLWPGCPFNKFLSALLGTDADQLLRELVSTGAPREVHARQSWLLVAARLLSDGVVLTFSDVTALKEREEEFAEAKRSAESANRIKSQFLATMSHELRTPLNAILGFSEIIRDGTFGNDPRAWNKYAQYAGSIHASGGHLLSLISEILDMSKIEAGSYALDLERVDVTEILSGAATLVSAAARKSGVEMHVDMPSTPVPMVADARSVRQIALNLLSNAIKFTPRGGQVRIGLSATARDVTFTVSDTGIGIAPEDLEAVFEPFRQVDSSVRRRHEGTGLGLAITKRLVEMHRGTIALKSVPGTSTTVTVTLPSNLAPDKLLATGAAA